MVPAWTFDRGNVRIYASPDEYANAEPLVGSKRGQTGRSEAEYDIDFPVAGEYTLTTKYASPEARPIFTSVCRRVPITAKRSGITRGACSSSRRRGGR